MYVFLLLLIKLNFFLKHNVNNITYYALFNIRHSRLELFIINLTTKKIDMIS